MCEFRAQELRDFETRVLKKFKYETVNLGSSFQYVNSTSNETLKNGSNKILVPINIPAYAYEWYYSFSASRNKAEVESAMSNVSLMGQLTEIVNGVNPYTSAAKIGLELITAPPGADYCDVYLLDQTNSQLFMQDNPSYK